MNTMKASKLGQIKCFLIGPLATLTIFITLLKSSGYDFLTPETGVAIIFMIVLGTLLGLIIVLSTTSLRLVIYAFLIAVTSNALFRPFPTFDWLVIGEWVYPLLILCMSLVLLWILRRKSDELLSVVFFVLFLSSFFVMARPASWQWQVNDTYIEQNTALPPYVHIVLDSHIGVGGLIRVHR